MDRMTLGSAVTALDDTVQTAHVTCDDADPVRSLRKQINGTDLAVLFLFVTPAADFETTVRDASKHFPDIPVIACSTAGELSGNGYTENGIVAVGLPKRLFVVETMLVEGLAGVHMQTLIDRTIRTRARLGRRTPESWVHEFAFLTIDGLSLKEDELTFAIATGLGPVPLFGGSAGDGARFEQTFVALNGRVYQDTAILTFVRTICPVKVFSLDHLQPTERRMVVTEADPSRRIVSQINAEPAAREYARVLGKDPEQLSPFTFAAHPVVVRIGGDHHVRAIQRVTEKGELVFFSAIDEGLVLTLAEPADIALHLKRELDSLSEIRKPDVILACDCILRRLEAGQTQKTSQISNTLAEHNVVGFSTYGEQHNALHVNHTMTGVAIYPPEVPMAPRRVHEQVADRPRGLARSPE